MTETRLRSRRAGSERLITYCGLFCGDCPRYGGKMSRLAHELRREAESSGLARAAQTRQARRGAFKWFPAFWETLGMIAGFECPGCRKAGRSVTCRIRPCCRRHGLTGCWECMESASCSEFRGLRTMHGKGIAYNLRALKLRGPNGFLRGRRYWLRLPRTPA